MTPSDKKMIAAIRQRKTWARGTAVRVLQDVRQDGKPLARVELHDTHIATVGYGPDGEVATLTITLGGEDTQTTRSRLTALVRAFADAHPDTLGVLRHDGATLLLDAAGVHRVRRDTEWVGVALAPGG